VSAGGKRARSGTIEGKAAAGAAVESKILEKGGTHAISNRKEISQ